MPNTAMLAALKIALPYVEKIAATQPTEQNRMLRQLEAVKHARLIRKAIADAENSEPCSEAA